MDNKDNKEMDEEQVTEIRADGIKKPLRRFNPFSYLEQYLPATHWRFNERITILYEIVEAYRKRRKDVRWAKCCFTVERHVARDSLGHPESEMIDLDKLLAAES